MLTYTFKDANGVEHPLEPDAYGVVITAIQRVDDEAEALYTGQPIGAFVAHETQIGHRDLAGYDDELLARWGITRVETPDPEPGPPPVPAVISALQLQQVLLAAGKLDMVEAAVAQAPRAIRIYYAKTSEFHRDHPQLIAMTASLGMTTAEVDALFIAAKQIT